MQIVVKIEREAQLYVFQNLRLTEVRKNTTLQNLQEKLLFNIAASYMTRPCNITLNKVFSVVALSFSLINVTQIWILFHNWVVANTR